MTDLHHIAQQFVPSSQKITPLGNGLINDTYHVIGAADSFVLQRINRQVFVQPEQIMTNLLVLNRHTQLKSGVDVYLQIPNLLPTVKGDHFYLDEKQDCWRALSFVANSESLEAIRTQDDAEQIGFALGHFHHLLSDLNPSCLQDTLPGFHIAPSYYNHYVRVSQQSKVIPHTYCAQFIAKYHSMTRDLETAKQQGWLALRVIHGDPKINNFLFDIDTQNVISLIDLDTVKPGLVHYDIGDCLRSCCNDGNNGFQLDIAIAIIKNYLAETTKFFTEYDYYYLYPAIRLLPFELGLRFYTDYLDGNHYFKVAEPEQNLYRAIGQFRLCENIMAQEAAIQAVIANVGVRKKTA